MNRYAEDANYWATTVHPAKSQAEIIELFEEFGIGDSNIMQGYTGGKYIWIIRFKWNDKSYRFMFTPLECKDPAKFGTYAGKKRTAEEQARYQMGRIAAAFVKAILTAAETTPAALFGFLELSSPKSGGLPPTAADLDISGVKSLLPDISLSFQPQLTTGNNIDGEYREV